MRAIAILVSALFTAIACGGSSPSNPGPGGISTGNIGNSTSGTGVGPGDNPGLGDTNISSATVTTNAGSGDTASSIIATHRSGQTFLVWAEVASGADYHDLTRLATTLYQTIS